MKSRTPTLPCLLAALLPLAVAGPLPVFAAPPPPAKPDIQQSVFVHPGNPAEGRDPFFPNSTRPYRSATPATNTPAAAASLTDLTLKSIMGTPPHVIAIINNHAFAAGDEGDIFTKAGRLRIRCVEINSASNTVTVEANGVNAELKLIKLP